MLLGLPWLAAVGGALWIWHRHRWGVDLTASQHWRHAWAAFLDGRLIIDTVDEVLQWGSLPAGLALAFGGCKPAIAAGRAVKRWLCRPPRDDSPLDDDYDITVITAPLPGGRGVAPKIELATLADLGLTDEALGADFERMAAQLAGAGSAAAADGYRPPAPAAPVDTAPAPSTPPAATPDGAGPAPAFPGLDASEQAVLRLFAKLAQAGWTEAVLRGATVASAARPDDRIELLLAGETRIHVLVLVAVPPGARAGAVDERGVWQLERSGQRWEVESPVVHAVALAGAVDEALQRAGHADAPIVVPVVAVTDGVLRADRDHEALWEQHDVLMVSDPPGTVTATSRPRSLATVLSADRPSAAVLDLVRDALDA